MLTVLLLALFALGTSSDSTFNFNANNVKVDTIPFSLFVAGDSLISPVQQLDSQASVVIKIGPADNVPDTEKIVTTISEYATTVLSLKNVAKNPNSKQIKELKKTLTLLENTSKDIHGIFLKIKEYEGTETFTQPEGCVIFLPSNNYSKIELSTLDTVTERLKDVSAGVEKYYEPGATAATKLQKTGGWVTLSNHANDVLSILSRALDGYEEILQLLNTLAEKRVPSLVLRKLDQDGCSNKGSISDNTRVDYCKKYLNNVMCKLHITAAKPTLGKIKMLFPTKFRIDNNVAVQLSLPYKVPIVDLQGAMVGDAGNCEVQGRKLICPDSKLEVHPDTCIEGILANEFSQILKSCRFRRLYPNEPGQDTKVWVLRLSEGRTIVSQLTDTNIIIRVGHKTVTLDPVYVKHKSTVRISYTDGKGELVTITVPGKDDFEDVAHPFGYNSTMRKQFIIESKTVDRLQHIVSQLLPDDVEELLVLIGIVLQSCMIIPVMVAIWNKCCRRRSDQMEDSMQHSSDSEYSEDEHESRGRKRVRIANEPTPVRKSPAIERKSLLRRTPSPANRKSRSKSPSTRAKASVRPKTTTARGRQAKTRAVTRSQAEYTPVNVSPDLVDAVWADHTERERRYAQADQASGGTLGARFPLTHVAPAQISYNRISQTVEMSLHLPYSVTEVTRLESQSETAILEVEETPESQNESNMRALARTSLNRISADPVSGMHIFPARRDPTPPANRRKGHLDFHHHT